ncbi:MAG: hypothetical protein H0X34_02155 [Chthoniobacterales bacterium]|nr:hypothetical protein [Chthoniobacterales bacterium]
MPEKNPPIDVPSRGIPGEQPLFPPNFQRLSSHVDWRRTWTHIVAGKFSKSGFSGLLFYEQSTGYAEFYETNGSGQIEFLQGHTGWRTSWTHIISGAFYGAERTGLLFYDQQAGFAAVYDTDGLGNLVFPPREYSGWRPSWTHITTIRLPEAAQNRDFSAILLYDQAAGHGEIHQCDGEGGLSLIREEDGWRTSWTHVVGDSFCGTGVLFYEQPTSHGEVYMVTGDDDSGFGFEQGAEKENLPPATHITPGNFGWMDSSFVFYDRRTGRGTFVFYNPPPDPSSGAGQEGSILCDPNDNTVKWESYDDWRSTWDVIVPGNFWEPDPEYVKFQNGFTDLLFYEGAGGYGEFYLHEPFEAIPAEDLEGYVSPGSVAQGETISFYVNSRVGPYTITVYRQDSEQTPITTVQDIRQFPQPFPIQRLDYRDGPAWPVVAEFTIPRNWRSGLYLARVEASVAETSVLDIPFVVRCETPGSQSRILLCIPDATWAAYNFWGGRSLYGFTTGGFFFWSFGPSLDPYRGDYQIPRAFRVALARPYREASGLPKWQQWEVPLIRWLARQGIDVELCTSTDLHKDQANHTDLLKRYSLLVSVGHDEYWSKGMRDNVEGFASKGGNVVFLSANVSWFQVRFDLNVQRQICYKDARFDPYNATDFDAGTPELVTVNWYDKPVCRAETAMTGVSYFEEMNGWPEYIIRDRDSWVFQNVAYSRFGLYTITGDPMPRSVVGYETDHLQSSQEECKPNSPPNFHTLAEVPAASGDFTAPNPEVAATMGIFTKGKGQVLTVGTINWSLGLSQDGEFTEIDQITLNIFTQLG